MSFYDVYHQQQLQHGAGGRGVNNVFVGAPRQKGHGLGSFFTGLFRGVLPYIARGARAVGKEALRAGVNIIEDVGENNMKFRDSFKNRMDESGQNLKRKAVEKIGKLMQGSGYKAVTHKRRVQSRRRTRTRKSRVKKNKRSNKIKNGRVKKRKNTRKSSSKKKLNNRKRKNKTKKSLKQRIFSILKNVVLT